jgi:hypothetical protein
LPGVARADDERLDASVEAGRVEAAGAAGSFLPLSVPAKVGAQPAYSAGSGGYDGARKTALLEAIAEVRVWGPLAIRGGAVYTTSDGRLRPTFGARAQLLSMGRHGVDGSVGVFYKPEGLTQAEGEIETVVALGTRVGATYLLGNLAYGQDPEGNERDGEARLAVLHPLGARVLVGMDSRLRFDLGSDAAHLAGKGEPTMDALLGPTATWFVDRFALSLHGGLAARRVDASTAAGAFVLAGIGSTL